MTNKEGQGYPRRHHRDGDSVRARMRDRPHRRHRGIRCRWQGQRHHPRRGCRHRTGMRHRRELPQPALRKTETPTGPALSLETPWDAMAKQGGEPKVRKTPAKYPRARARRRTGRPYRDGKWDWDVAGLGDGPASVHPRSSRDNLAFPKPSQRATLRPEACGHRAP